MTPDSSPQTAAKAAATGPLAGVRILDLTAVVLGPLATQVLGPLATQILGDYGAEIIKIEALEGDLMRANGVSRNQGMSSIFLALNRNKRSLSIDLKTAQGGAVLERLVASAEVLVHTMRVAAIERPAFDDIIQAARGLVGLNLIQQSLPDYVPSLIADKTTGMAMVNAVLAALFHRERHGRGQQVEVPVLETMTAFVLAEHLGGLTVEPQEAPAGYARLLTGGRKPAATKDGFIAMLPDIARTQTTAEWMAICDELDVPATPIYRLEELPGHPHLKAVNFLQTAEMPGQRTIRCARPPIRFMGSPAQVRSFAPLLGEHTNEILAEAGFTAGEIDRLAAAGVIRRATVAA